MHYSVLVFWFAVGGLVISVIGIFAIDTEPLFQDWTPTTWILCSQQAALGIVGSMLMTKATCWVSPAKVMVIRSFQIIISYIVQVVSHYITDLEIILSFLTAWLAFQKFL